MTKRCRNLVLTLLVITGCGAPQPQPVPATSQGRTVLSPVATASGTAHAEHVRAADVSILFIGNSHSGMHDLPGLVSELIRQRRPAPTVHTQYLPVGFLEDAATNPACLAEIDERSWKFVVLQAQKISQSGRYNYSRQEGIDLAKRAKARGATVVFYPEWGMKGVAGDGPRQEQVYREMARAADVKLAPVARAWDLALAERPELPLHDADGNHQSPQGAFLTACVLAGTLTGDSPASFAALPYSAAGEAERRFLADCAAKALVAEAAPAVHQKP